jgi:DNA-binding FadR family transcriptional regulator
MNQKFTSDQLSEFMKYLATSDFGENDRLPPLTELSRQLGISIASLREQLEVARVMGLVEVRPRTGIRRLPYTFKPAVLQSLAYGQIAEEGTFALFSDLRRHIESAYWYQAVGLLNAEDHDELRDLVKKAFEKLHGTPIQIPHQEHHQLHLTIFRRLNNPFVIGILEAFWELYEAYGLGFYTDLNYQERVWDYHNRMVEAICCRNFNIGFEALTQHMDLIFQRTRALPNLAFE